ncbi:MAG: ATP-binding protein [Candidatus Limnocylindria bacterium]
MRRQVGDLVWRYGAAFAAVLATTAMIGAVLSVVQVANISMLYLVTVLGTAILLGRGPAIAASIAAFLAFTWFFVEPVHTLTVGDPKEWFALTLFVITAAITGQLAAGQRARAREAADRAREATLMFEIARVLGDIDLDAALRNVTERLRVGLGVPVAVVELDDAAATRRITAGDPTLLDRAPLGALAAWIGSTHPTGRAAARWIRLVDPGIVGAARDDRVHAVPLTTEGRRLGTLAVLGERHLSAADDRILVAVAAQLAGAIDRARLRRRATDAEVLRRADELKSALLGAVSHDLRTPLASIIASAGSLRQTDVRWTDAEREQFLKDIEQEAARLTRIVGNLLDLSRMESGTLDPDRSWYDLAALIDDVLGRLRPITRGHRVEVTVPEDLPPVSLDYVEIDQVITNLIENAVRHTPAGSHILISVSVAGTDAAVEISDDGPGIAIDAIDRLFEPFFRGSSSPSPRGTGLGLAVARGLVEAHGGRISVQNRPNGGAAFRFTLPIRPAADAALVAPR